MNSKLLLLTGLLLNALCSAAEDFKWSDNCHKAYLEASKLNFVKAGQYAAAEKKVRPGNLFIPYIESQVDFIKTFISEDKADLARLKEKNNERISSLEKYNGKSPHKKLIIAEYYLQIAVVRLKFEEYLGAVYDTRKGFKLLVENNKLYPGHKPNLRGLGFIHAVVGSAPKNYQWFASLLGFSGTIDKGLGELRTLLDATYHEPELAYLRDETVVLLTFLEMNLSKDKSNENIRKRFYTLDNIAEKPLVLFAKSSFHFANAENDSIINMLSRRTKAPEAYRLNYLDFLEGNARLNNLDYSAEKNYKQYISNFKGKSFVKTAYQRIAWLKLLQGDKNGYAEYIAKAGDPKTGNVFTDDDKQAVKEFTTKETPNLLLLRSRLLFDGGYYQRSLSEIAGKPTDLFPSLRDKLEFTYRLARIFEKTGKKEKAITYYQQTIQNGHHQKYYFAANSALLIGLIYELDGNFNQAEKYFKQCLEMRDHEYQNSIDQKAKAGLNRIGK